MKKVTISLILKQTWNTYHIKVSVCEFFLSTRFLAVDFVGPTPLSLLWVPNDLAYIQLSFTRVTVVFICLVQTQVSNENTLSPCSVSLPAFEFGTWRILDSCFFFNKKTATHIFSMNNFCCFLLFGLSNLISIADSTVVGQLLIENKLDLSLIITLHFKNALMPLKFIIYLFIFRINLLLKSRIIWN